MYRLYAIVLFLHISSAIAMFAAIAIELGGLASLRRATTAAQLHDALRTLGMLRRLAAPSMLLLLASGIYLVATGTERGAWLMIALVGIVVMAAIGMGLIRRRMRALAQAASTVEGGLPISLQDRLRDPVVHMAAWLRAALVIGIVYDMTVKPALVESLAAIVVALAAGALLAMRRGQPPAVAVPATARTRMPAA